VRQPLTLIADVESVRILDAQAEVARHPRAWGVRQVVEHPEHLAELVDTKRQARELKARDRLRAAVPDSERLFLELARRGEPLGRHAARLFALLDAYGADELRAAVAIAIAREAWGAGSVAHILEQRRRANHQPPRAPVDLPADPRVRDLRITPHNLGDYDALLDDDDDDDTDPTD
jgi:hypothetical protein